MLKITVPKAELWNELKEEFIYSDEQTLELEHSLLSVSKWESKWCKSFIATKEMTYEETIDYIKCMTLTRNVKPVVYKCLTAKNISDVKQYINAPMTATHFSNAQSDGSQIVKETVTSELIYYWMISLNIPFECQKWHINRLLTLIRVCEIKNTPPKKMNKSQIMSRNAALNAARRAQLNTKG